MIQGIIILLFLGEGLRIISIGLKMLISSLLIILGHINASTVKYMMDF
jgi:hypothetical protein